MSLLSLLANMTLIIGIRRTKVFGKGYGTISILRSSMEAVCALITLAFFSPIIFLDEIYEVPSTINVTITAVFITCLACSYASHLVISLNRLFAVYLPISYSRVFDDSNRITVVIILVLIFGFVTATLDVIDPCFHLIFSSYLIDLTVNVCEQRNFKFPPYFDVIILLWSICATSALVVDLIALVGIVAHSLKKSSANSKKSTLKNIRFFAQTFFVNVVVCAGIYATRFCESWFDSELSRFWFCEFQVLLGFVVNGITPIFLNKDLSDCFRVKKVTVVQISAKNTVEHVGDTNPETTM
ncbi:hypothetical protein L596_017323 [Steinernema carpocapsae]|uniref:G-protein coupled receptors family 1 profile domain-containing protein n=1 Tax=Steinernema carpocapsae TaxID=34508 RepID=A0A4U5N224_STECR|nr:hypothetical protein L596_017323 [Steinernema carpocapsae]